LPIFFDELRFWIGRAVFRVKRPFFYPDRQVFKNSFLFRQVSSHACVLDMPNSSGRQRQSVTGGILPEKYSTKDFMIIFDKDADGNLISIEVIDNNE